MRVNLNDYYSALHALLLVVVLTALSRRHVKITLRRVKIRHLKWQEFRFIMDA